jgi:hypothetical protein
MIPRRLPTRCAFADRGVSGPAAIGIGWDRRPLRPGSLASGGSMATPRAAAAAITLADGRVRVAGGMEGIPAWMRIVLRPSKSDPRIESDYGTTCRSWTPWWRRPREAPRSRERYAGQIANSGTHKVERFGGAIWSDSPIEHDCS